MALDVVEGGVRYLAVPVGSPARGTALTRILAVKGSPGWIAAPPSIREWRFTGVTERSGGTMLFGPWMPARSLASIIELPAEEALGFFVRLAEALALLKERRISLFPLQTDAVLFCDDGSVLFLPADVMRELRELRPFATNCDAFECIHNPDKRGEDMVSFALGALLYRELTGAFPFTGESTEDIHEQMRKLEILSPAEAAVGTNAEASETIMAALSRSTRGIPSLDEWAERLRAWQREGTLRAPSAAGKPAEAPEAEVRRRNSQKRFRRRVFWEKNWRTVLVIAAVVVLVGAGLGSILKGVLAPRVTHGDTPRQVVEAFYTGMNRLDQTTMSACVIGGAGKGEINEVTNLYVISRVSTGYEGRSNIVSAEDWDKAGRPPIPSPRTLYGVTGLAVAQAQSEPQPVFLVSYDKWAPLPVNDEAAAGLHPAPRYDGHSVQDRVFLKADRGDWVIYRIDRLRLDPLRLN